MNISENKDPEPQDSDTDYKKLLPFVGLISGKRFASELFVEGKQIKFSVIHNDWHGFEFIFLDFGNEYDFVLGSFGYFEYDDVDALQGEVLNFAKNFVKALSQRVERGPVRRDIEDDIYSQF
jgi:hypothetical protein